ncbi:hypothetical protein [uncultured Nonlabens sp.]|uniref:hypothetical protein n=1 Tax=uncultured Nonlabens sp. TaxID=859306 RepID=UPI002606AF1A|nr:hypothetical protein [uncultured Nonlabens sp.]
MKTLSLNESSSVMGGDKCSRLTARLARLQARTQTIRRADRIYKQQQKAADAKCPGFIKG